MKISFIIALYNCEKYIEDCLNSILKIKHEKYEIIVVNDGSTDKSEEIVKRYTDKYPQVHLYNKKNEGLSLTRNFGINKATGSYLFFVDADDLIVPTEIDKIIKLCIEDKFDVIAGTYMFIDEHMKQTNAPFAMEKNHGEISDLEYLYLLPNYTAEAVKYIVKKEFLISNNLYFEANIFHEDELYMPQLLVTVDKEKMLIYYEPFYLYRKHQNSITTTLNIKKQYDSLFICGKLYSILSTQQDSIKAKFIAKRANLLFISSCSSIYKFKKTEQKMLIKQIKPLFKLFKNNIMTKKEKTALILLSVFGFKGFSIIQKIRKK